MKIPSLIRDAQTFIDKNSPQILTAFAVAGTALTGYLAAKGGMKAAKDIQDFEAKENGLWIQSTTQEKVLITWKSFAPAVVVGTGTAACMVMATKIGLSRSAALGAALVVVERNNEQYRAKVKEILGQNKDTKVVDEMAKDQVAAMPSSSLPLPREGEQTFVDAWTGRAFSTTMETINKHVNDFNKEILYGGYADLNGFYKRLGLAEITEGDEIGWSKGDLLELVYTTTLKDDRAVVVFTFDKKPSATFQDDYV